MTIKSKRQREQMMLFVLIIENPVMQACFVPLFMYFAGPTFCLLSFFSCCVVNLQYAILTQLIVVNFQQVSSCSLAVFW